MDTLLLFGFFSFHNDPEWFIIPILVAVDRRREHQRVGRASRRAEASNSVCLCLIVSKIKKEEKSPQVLEQPGGSQPSWLQLPTREPWLCASHKSSVPDSPWRVSPLVDSFLARTGEALCWDSASV